MSVRSNRGWRATLGLGLVSSVLPHLGCFAASPGELDRVFAPAPVSGISRVEGVGPGGVVLVYVAQRFCPADGRLVQYLSDGRVDPGFTQDLLPGIVRNGAYFSDGSIIARLLSDGSLDYSFDPLNRPNMG